MSPALTPSDPEAIVWVQMNDFDRNTVLQVGPYTGMLAEPCRLPEVLDRLTNLPGLLAGRNVIVLHEGRNRNVLLTLDEPCGLPPLVIKAFGPQSALKDRVDRVRGSKASRTWAAARHLALRGVGTPRPLGYLDRWEGGRLKESYYLAEYFAGSTSFHSELIRLFRSNPVCASFMTLLETVAGAVRRLHDAGLQHNDLGNQNILLRRGKDSSWADVRFIDLNRARLANGRPLSDRRRGRDLSRLNLPSDFMRVFREMYWGPTPPSAAFLRWERFYRRAYALHCATRRWRHPWRARRDGAPEDRYPEPRDMWVWDDRSGQAVNALASRERRKQQTWRRHLAIAGAALADGPAVWREYRRCRQACFTRPILLSGRIGVCVDPAPSTFSRQLALLERLGSPPVRVRFHHHEDESMRLFRTTAVEQLRERDMSVSIALVQDRRAVQDPRSWEHFVAAVLDRLGHVAESVEIGHAINRVKWGIWDADEYRRLLAGVAKVVEARPELRLTGPAVIDFEYPFVLRALRDLPPELHYHALSHLLYVDRRGAPENRQGPFSAVEKFALARAMARVSPRCEDRLVVSEVNWPLAGTGVYSPVGSPYVSPGVRLNDPSVDEDTYGDYMIRYLVLALCSGMVDRVYWWRLAARGYGLIDDTDPHRWRLRPAFSMLEQMLTLLGGAVFEPAAGGEMWPDGVRAFTFRLPGDQRVTLAYAPDGPREVEAPFDVAGIRDALGRPLSVSGATCRLTGRPVYIWHG